MEAKKEAKKGKKKKDEDEEDNGDEQKLVIPPAPKLEDEVVDLPEEEPPMYFKEPQQLMDIFSALEEQNLFLIQNSQETERTLEELQHAFKETKSSMESRTGQLSDQISELQAQITAEEQRSAALKLKRQVLTVTHLLTHSPTYSLT
jgi:DNA anti-recombination protein RmuC